MVTKTDTKCSKKAGEPCRVHNPITLRGKEYFKREMFVKKALAEREKNVFKRMLPNRLVCNSEEELIAAEKAEKELKKQQELAKKQLFIVENMRKNLNEKVDYSTFKRTVSIFRSGVPYAPNQRGVESESYVYADAMKPANRQGRVTGVFASPTSFGVTRWFTGNDLVNLPDVKVRELRVDPDETYVYSIDAWERASSALSMYSSDTPENLVKREEAISNYWNSGITLTDWMNKAEREHVDPRNWEVLLSSDDIKTVKPFGSKRLMDSIPSESEYEYNDLKRIVKKHYNS